MWFIILESSLGVRASLVRPISLQHVSKWNSGHQILIPQYSLVAEVSEKVCYRFATIMRQDNEKEVSAGYKIQPLLMRVIACGEYHRRRR